MGAEHPSVARFLLALASLLRDQGKYEQVDELYQRALNIQVQRLGATHLLTQKTRNDYKAFFRSIGSDTEAKALAVNDEPLI